MKIAFRCKRSGNTVFFTNENDVEGMRKHEGYEEVKIDTIPETPSFLQTVEPAPVKRMGRPKKGV